MIMLPFLVPDFWALGVDHRGAEACQKKSLHRDLVVLFQVVVAAALGVSAAMVV